MKQVPQVVHFVHETDWDRLPAPIRRQTVRCLLDSVGTAIGGRGTPLSRIVHDFAAETYARRGAFLWLDGREVSPAGAALANGMMIDALDIHDGHSLTKGHAGAAVIPALFATLSLAAPSRGAPVSGRELLTSLAVGYEVALRSGIAPHATAPDYHSSGCGTRSAAPPSPPGDCGSRPRQPGTIARRAIDKAPRLRARLGASLRSTPATHETISSFLSATPFYRDSSFSRATGGDCSSTASASPWRHSSAA